MKVYLIGAGPGDVGLLTIRAKEILSFADVVVYDALVNEALLDFSQGEKIFVGKRRGWHARSQEEISALLVERAQSGQRVARLKGGDPFLFGRGGEEAQALVAAKIPFEVVPGVSSALAVPAYAGIPVTHRTLCRQLTICTGHSAVQGAPPLDFASLVKSQGTLVFLMSRSFLAQNISQLLSHGMSPQTPAALIENGSLPSQRVVCAPLEELAQKAAHLGAPAILVVGEVARFAQTLSWYQPRSRRVLVTRAASQAQELSALLREAGFIPVLAPMFSLRPLPIAPEALAALSSFDWLLFTSAKAVSFFFEALYASGRDTRALSHSKIAAVGDKTAAALKSQGIVADLLPAEQRAEALAEALPDIAGQRVLLPQAREVAFDLPGALSQRGALVEALLVYENEKTSAPPPPLEEVDALSFASPSAVEGFVARCPEAAELFKTKAVVVIGPTTRKALSSFEIPRLYMAARPSMAAMVEALYKAFE